MAVPIIIFYALGFIFFFFAIEGNGKQIPADLIYPGMGFFVNTIGYYISYSDPDYAALAYFPLAMMIISMLFLIYRVYQAMPKEQPWGEGELDEYRGEKVDLN